jgi:hypothetical protein
MVPTTINFTLGALQAAINDRLAEAGQGTRH